jgi:probable HAF family extracellular repeat protein
MVALNVCKGGFFMKSRGRKLAHTPITLLYRNIKSTAVITAVLLSMLVTLSAPCFSEGLAWQSYVSFAPSTSGRTDAVAIFHQGTLYVLGGQPYRCPGVDPCAEPELGAADYLPAGGAAWLKGRPFDDRLQRLGGGVDALNRPVAFGGSQGDVTDATVRTFIYDTVQGDQTEPSLQRRNFSHSNFAWATDHLGRLYSIGGGPGETATAISPNRTDVERYDALSDSWTVLASLPEARANAAAAYDGQGHILVFGGYDGLATERASDVLIYDIANDRWDTLGQLPMPTVGDNGFSDQRARLGANGIVYIVGGINGPVGAGTTQAQVYTYEPVTATWGRAPPLTTPRHGVALTLDDSGWLYALGGRNGDVGLSSNERLDTRPAGDQCVTDPDCSDGLACNGEEFCIDGSCLPGIPVQCGPDEICISGGSCRLQRFDIIDLSALLGGASANAHGIDPTGRVVGDYFDSVDGKWHGFLYDGVMHDLGSGSARAISSDGWVAGDDGTAYVIDPAGTRTDLGKLGGSGSSAYAVSRGGWVVGQSDTESGVGHAFLVRGPGAAMEDLGTLGDYSIAHGIDLSGLIVGESLVTSLDPHAEPFVFDATDPLAVMEEMPVGYPAGSARAINDLGHSTGWVANHVDNWGDAFVFDGVVTTRLGDIPGKAHSIGTAINNADQVVGYAFGEWVDTGCCGRVWSNSIHRAYFHDGVTAVNLNDELPESSGWLLTRATGINDNGAIIGTGLFDGAGRAFLMIPHGSDQDGDGIPDSLDNCPTRHNPGQDNADTDHHGDVCDNCTLVENEDQRDTDNDDFGNICDPDFDNSLNIDFADLAVIK